MADRNGVGINGTQKVNSMAPSTSSPLKDPPPTEEEILEIIQCLKSMPSNDKATRQKIANIPWMNYDPGFANLMCSNSENAKMFFNSISAVVDLLQDYNAKLDWELEERKRAADKLRAFIELQKGLLAQSEQLLEEHRIHIQNLTEKWRWLISHVSHLPDVPSVENGLAPLPSLEELFDS